MTDAHAVDPALRLAGEIADHFRGRPVDQAADEIAAHIRKFWDPRVRRRLVAAVDDGGTDDPLVARVTELVRAGLRKPQ